MSKTKRTLKQIAIDMRAAGEMLIEGAAEIEAAGTLLESVNLSALTTLLGGGAVESAPFRQADPSASTSVEQSPRRRAAGKRSRGSEKEARKLTKEQKAELREKWSRLPENMRTDAQKMAWAQRYGVSCRYITLVVAQDLERAKQHAAMARAALKSRRSMQNPATHTSVN